ncbi:MAG TPA: glutaredoxin family protein [Sulfuriferula sp.]|nr:glutaredoxin family protein [Sulfuriferula sp.]
MVLLLCATSVYASQVYRWVDKNGHVQYSDQPPPSDVKKSEQRTIGSNVIDGQDSYPLKQAVAKNPVVLYAGACGMLCDEARKLLDKRGIPYAAKDPQNNKADADALMSLIGAMEVPALKVGNKHIKGFDANRWDSMLDEAGYPKSNPPLRERKTDAAAPGNNAGQPAASSPNK